MPTIDHAAKKVLDAQDAYYKQWPDASSNGHLWRVRRRSDALAQPPEQEPRT
jgi:hypothetical protein